MHVSTSRAFPTDTNPEDQSIVEQEWGTQLTSSLPFLLKATCEMYMQYFAFCMKSALMFILVIDSPSAYLSCVLMTHNIRDY